MSNEMQDWKALEARLKSQRSKKVVRKKKLRESDIESYGGDVVKGLGGIPYKFTSPSRRSVPDRLNLLPVPEEHRAIVAKYVRFVEYKAPNVTASEAQLREHARLRDLGFFVAVVDSHDGADTTFNPANF